MTSYASKFMQTLVGRGFLYQCTDEAGLDKLASTDKLVGYITHQVKTNPVKC